MGCGGAMVFSLCRRVWHDPPAGCARARHTVLAVACLLPFKTRMKRAV